MRWQRGATQALLFAQSERAETACRSRDVRRIAHTEPPNAFTAKLRTGLERDFAEPELTGERFGEGGLGPGLSIRRCGFGDQQGMANGRAGGLRVCFHECWRRVRGGPAQVCVTAHSRDL